MHDEEFPGDRGYRFENKGDASREQCPHLYKGKQVIIPLEDVMKDVYDCDFTREPSVDVSYKEFLRYFERVDAIKPHEFVIGATFTYSWMQTTLTLRHQDRFEDVSAYLDAVRLGNDLDGESLSLIKSVVNNSMVGTSKLLHFVNPERYAIYDSWVDTYLYGTPSDSRLYSVDHYMSYTCACRRAVEDERFEEVHQRVNKLLGYEVTALRALELIMFLTAKARGRK